MLLAKHNTDATAYYEGVAYKVSGQNAIHTMLGNSKITMRVQNVNGTIIFNYNDAMSTDITLTVFKFLLNYEQIKACAMWKYLPLPIVPTTPFELIYPYVIPFIVHAESLIGMPKVNELG